MLKYLPDASTFVLPLKAYGYTIVHIPLQVWHAEESNEPLTGIELYGHALGLDPLPTPDEAEAARLNEADRVRHAEEQRAIEQSEALRRGVHRLWEHAASTLRVRHPDPRVDVRLLVQDLGYIRITFMFKDLRNTQDPDHRMWPSFHHAVRVGYTWPGLGPAQKFIAAWWALYMVHEGLELTTLRTREWEVPLEERGRWAPDQWRPSGREWLAPSIRAPETSVVDPHDYGAHQDMLCGDKDSDEAMASVIDYIVGLGKGMGLLLSWRDRAARDIANEIEPWEPGC